MSFGIPKAYNLTSHDGQALGQQALGQQVLGQQMLGQQVLGQQVVLQQQQIQGGKGQYKEFEQPRYYGSPMMMQQPFVQVTTGQAPQMAQGPQPGTYNVNQQIVYPSQPQMYETRPVNSYLLIHQGQDQGQAAASFYGSGRGRTDSDQPVLYEGYVERLQQLLPVPPLAQAMTRPEINLLLNLKRARRKSKFTKKQDDVIVDLKRKGKSWVEIAELSGVGSYLAARNRYQVIVGQQGNNNSSSWGNEDKSLLQKLLDDAEMEKWRFIAIELNKATGKSFTDRECRETVRMLFWSDPASFGVSEDTINECFKEKKITERANEQQQYMDNERQYTQPFFGSHQTPANTSQQPPTAPALQLYNSYQSKSSPESIDNYAGAYY